MKYLGLWSPGVRFFFWNICKTLHPLPFPPTYLMYAPLHCIIEFLINDSLLNVYFMLHYYFIFENKFIVPNVYISMNTIFECRSFFFKVNIYSYYFLLKPYLWNSGTVKHKMITRKWTDDLPHELLNDLRLRILGNE